MTFDEWYENLTADCPTWRTSIAVESAQVVWEAATAAEHERMLRRCQGKTHAGCAYLAHCGSVCNKCGQVA